MIIIFQLPYFRIDTVDLLLKVFEVFFDAFENGRAGDMLPVVLLCSHNFESVAADDESTQFPERLRGRLPCGRTFFRAELCDQPGVFFVGFRPAHGRDAECFNPRRIDDTHSAIGVREEFRNGFVINSGGFHAGMDTVRALFS